ncbi:hypothetical protein ABZ372_54700, partial [Streptomyces sp. NPDC005921]
GGGTTMNATVVMILALALGTYAFRLVGPALHTPRERRAFETGMVAELRATAARYPGDRQLRRLIAELRAGSERFAELWDAGVVGRLEASRKTIEHPQVGLLTLDCDQLRVEEHDLHILVYSAEPGTEDAEKLALISVLGTQSLAPGP